MRQALRAGTAPNERRYPEIPKDGIAFEPGEAGFVISLVTCSLIGAALASFIGVVLDRVPRGESIVFPASHCAACGTFLSPWDNLPVVSWVMLRGRCRHCAAFIPLQFLVLEVVGAAAGATVALTVFH